MSMAGSSEVRTLLSRHKVSLLSELNTTDLLNVLVKRGVITEIDKDAVAGNVDRSTDSDVDLFIDIIGAKGFDAFREFCFALDKYCPDLLTNLLVNQQNTAGESFFFLLLLPYRYIFYYSIFLLTLITYKLGKIVLLKI